MSEKGKEGVYRGSSFYYTIGNTAQSKPVCFVHLRPHCILTLPLHIMYSPILHQTHHKRPILHVSDHRQPDRNLAGVSSSQLVSQPATNPIGDPVDGEQQAVNLSLVQWACTHRIRVGDKPKYDHGGCDSGTANGLDRLLYLLFFICYLIVFSL